MRASARELLVPFFYTFGMVRPRDSNPRPPAPKADALPTELSRMKLVSFSFYMLSPPRPKMPITYVVNVLATCRCPKGILGLGGGGKHLTNNIFILKKANKTSVVRPRIVLFAHA